MQDGLWMPAWMMFEETDGETASDLLLVKVPEL
jgi:hypothetical protein